MKRSLPLLCVSLGILAGCGGSGAGDTFGIISDGSYQGTYKSPGGSRIGTAAVTVSASGSTLAGALTEDQTGKVTTLSGTVLATTFTGTATVDGQNASAQGDVQVKNGNTFVGSFTLSNGATTQQFGIEATRQ